MGLGGGITPTPSFFLYKKANIAMLARKGFASSTSPPPQESKNLEKFRIISSVAGEGGVVEVFFGFVLNLACFVPKTVFPRIFGVCWDILYDMIFLLF